MYLFLAVSLECNSYLPVTKRSSVFKEFPAEHSILHACLSFDGKFRSFIRFLAGEFKAIFTTIKPIVFMLSLRASYQYSNGHTPPRSLLMSGICWERKNVENQLIVTLPHRLIAKEDNRVIC